MLFKIPVGESVAKFTQGLRRTRKVSQATWSQGSLRKHGRVSPGSERNVGIESLFNGNKIAYFKTENNMSIPKKDIICPSVPSKAFSKVLEMTP